MADSCEYARRVSLYHDGELTGEERLLIEAHLTRCPACARELAELRALSKTLRESEIPALPEDVLRRLHETAPPVRERVLLRMAEILAAAAALVLIVTGLWIWRDTEQPGPASLSQWELAAVALRVEPSAPEDQQVAQWIVDDLSSENGDD